MFGTDNQNDQNQQDSAAPVISPAPDELVNENQANNQAPAAGAPAFDASGGGLDQPAPAAPAPAFPVDEPQTNDAASAAVPTEPAADDDHLLAPSGTDDLISIKQNALQQLSPLVDHLEQTPEEKFRTTMMMIQASDDQTLIKSAYDAAKEIKDDKARAQALLDIINEINYFTQQQKSDS